MVAAGKFFISAAIFRVLLVPPKQSSRKSRAARAWDAITCRVGRRFDRATNIAWAMGSPVIICTD